YIPVAAIVGHWFVKHTAIATGVSMLGIGIGGGLFPIITQSFLRDQGYQGAFSILAGITLTALIPVAIFVRKPDRKTREAAEGGLDEIESSDNSNDLTLTQALKSRSFWGLNLGDLLTGMVFAIFNAALVSYITEDTGDADLATMVFSVFGIGLGFGIILFGPLGEVFNFRRVFALCYFLPSVGTAILAFSSQPAAAYSFAIIAGFAGGGRSALFPAAILKSFGGTNMASIYGVSNTLFMFGIAGGPLIAGALLEATGTTKSIYIFGVVVFLISTFLVSLIRDERVRQPGATES
ncbi:MAG: MFS transporter, partial [Candidatus Hydrogenedentota bacterium]